MSSRGKIKNKQTENQDSKGFSPQDSSSKTLRQLPSDQKQGVVQKHFVAGHVSFIAVQVIGNTIYSWASDAVIQRLYKCI